MNFRLDSLLEFLENRFPLALFLTTMESEQLKLMREEMQAMRQQLMMMNEQNQGGKAKKKSAPKKKGPMSYQEKRELTNSINQLPADKVNRVVEIIKSSSAMGLSGDNDDEVELDMDTLDEETLQKLKRYVTQVVNNAKIAKKTEKETKKRPSPKAAADATAGDGEAGVAKKKAKNDSKQKSEQPHCVRCCSDFNIGDGTRCLKEHDDGHRCWCSDCDGQGTPCERAGCGKCRDDEEGKSPIIMDPMCLRPTHAHTRTHNTRTHNKNTRRLTSLLNLSRIARLHTHTHAQQTLVVSCLRSNQEWMDSGCEGDWGGAHEVNPQNLDEPEEPDCDKCMAAWKAHGLCDED